MCGRSPLPMSVSPRTPLHGQLGSVAWRALHMPAEWGWGGNGRRGWVGGGGASPGAAHVHTLAPAHHTCLCTCPLTYIRARECTHTCIHRCKRTDGQTTRCPPVSTRGSKLAEAVLIVQAVFLLLVKHMAVVTVLQVAGGSKSAQRHLGLHQLRQQTGRDGEEDKHARSHATTTTTTTTTQAPLPPPSRPAIQRML